MSDFNEELLAEINTLRTNPKKYARIISKYISYFKGNLLCLPGTNAGIQTEEGEDAYREAVEYLSNQSEIEALKPSKGLCRIAEEFIAAVQKPDSGDLENNMEDIIEKYGSFSGSFSRAMDFGGETPEQAVINLIVSDGDKSRGQRESLLSRDIKKIGLANGPHETYRHCTAIVTCTEFKNNLDKDDNGLLYEEKEREEKAPLKSKKTPLKYEENYQQPKLGDKYYKRDEPQKYEEVNKYSKKQKNEEKDKEEKLPPGVVSIDKTEKIITERGAKKKITRIVKVMEDGSKQVETMKVVIDE